MGSVVLKNRNGTAITVDDGNKQLVAALADRGYQPPKAEPKPKAKDK